MRPLLARRKLPVVVGGLLGWIHHEDAAAATVAALEHGRAGQAYNLVDQTPATWQQMFSAMANGLGAPPPRKVPGWVFRLAAPLLAKVGIDTSMRVSNAKARAELGWDPMYPTYREGIAAMAAGVRGSTRDGAN
jgi:nucleoside-diphosphate-sugar epimerase